MKNFFISIKTALAITLMTSAANQGMAQRTSIQFLSGKSHNNPSSIQSSNAKVNAQVSRPGNSQDYSTLGTGNWQLETNSAYTYDTQGRLTQRLYTDPTTSQNIQREVNVLDANGNDIESRIEQWTSGSWAIMDGNKWLITYNTQGKKTETISQFWDGNSSQWKNNNREQITYDTNGLVATITNSHWNNNNWELGQRGVYSNSGGTATSAIIQEYDGATWHDIERVQNVTWHILYETPLAYVLQEKDNGIWVNSEKYSSVYDANGGHVGIEQVWNIIGNNWENSFRETGTYDSNKNYTGWRDEEWNSTSNTWDIVDDEREVLTYSGIDVTQRIFQSLSMTSNTVEDNSKEVYSNFQTFTVAGLKNEIPQEIAANIYPNPTQNMLNIELPENTQAVAAQLTDLTSKEILNQHFKPSEAKQLNLENLKPGIYLLTLQTKKGKTVRKIVKN